MVSEFSIQPFRSQEEAQAYREGVGALPAQAAWAAGLMLPSTGISDFLGLYPEMPTEEQMIPTEQMPSFGENIANKQYLDAILQSAGVLGDAAYASIPLTGPYGAIAGTALKGIGAVGKASKGAKVKGLSSLPESEDYITAYHGSDADFDKFDISKMGSGEGYQMYGYGFYFTKSKKKAEKYTGPKGKTYEVDIDIKEDELLDFSKPLHKQPNKAVRKKIDSMPYLEELKIEVKNNVKKAKDEIKELENLKTQLKESGSDTIDVYRNQSLGTGPRNLEMIEDAIRGEKQLLKNITQNEGLDLYTIAANNEILTKNLKSVGIKGIKVESMEDDMYVIFDTRILDITKKYGVTIPVAGAMLLAQDQEMAAAQNDSLDL